MSSRHCVTRFKPDGTLSSEFPLLLQHMDEIKRIVGVDLATDPDAIYEYELTRPMLQQIAEYLTDGGGNYDIYPFWQRFDGCSFFLSASASP